MKTLYRPVVVSLLASILCLASCSGRNGQVVLPRYGPGADGPPKIESQHDKQVKKHRQRLLRKNL